MLERLDEPVNAASLTRRQPQMDHLHGGRCEIPTRVLVGLCFHQQPLVLVFKKRSKFHHRVSSSLFIVQMFSKAKSCRIRINLFSRPRPRLVLVTAEGLQSLGNGQFPFGNMSRSNRTLSSCRLGETGTSRTQSDLCSCCWISRLHIHRPKLSLSPSELTAEGGASVACQGAALGFSLEISRSARFSKLKFRNIRASRAPMLDMSRKSAVTVNKVPSNSQRRARRFMSFEEASKETSSDTASLEDCDAC
ncbi:hypothetical protein GOODEAATRI_021595 [Goodea atripinnis]|uniref:Uncharacterized protein n=1 Tax=Goodea atripinnis TaxID=208336 RepID=A0ABV0NM51_9TELE